jgi:hypothetical protein
MKGSLVWLVASGSLVALLVLPMPSEAASCQARCNQSYDPADYPKDQRWAIQRKLDQCMAACRTRK